MVGVRPLNEVLDDSGKPRLDPQCDNRGSRPPLLSEAQCLDQAMAARTGS